MNHRQLSSRTDTPAYEAPGLLGVVTKGLRETRRSRGLMVDSPAVIMPGLLGRRAANAQTVIHHPSGSTGTTGHITLDKPLVGAAIRLNQDRGGRKL
jgi:hypothetical protein